MPNPAMPVNLNESKRHIRFRYLCGQNPSRRVSIRRFSESHSEDWKYSRQFQFVDAVSQRGIGLMCVRERDSEGENTM